MRYCPTTLFPQYADLLDLQFYHVARIEVAPEVVAAAGADGSRADDFARVQRLRVGDMREYVRELVVHGGGIAAAPARAVDAHLHLERMRVADLVERDDPRPQHVAAVEILALGRAEPALHLGELRVARGEIVKDGEAENMLERALARDVLGRPTDHAGKLQLEVHDLGVLRPHHVGVGAGHAEAVAFVIDRLAIPHVGNRSLHPCSLLPLGHPVPFGPSRS